MRYLSAKAMSFLTYRNQLHEQVRRAFVMGAYYAALVAAVSYPARVRPIASIVASLTVTSLARSPNPCARQVRLYCSNSMASWP